jgi:hypothetical protein
VLLGAAGAFLEPIMRATVLMGYLGVEIHTTRPAPSACISQSMQITSDRSSNQVQVVHSMEEKAVPSERL